jgi:ubiquinone/menaquinone biosynthesis C-methylase UbiE
MDAGTYHQLELRIARNPADARRSMPAIDPACRTILDVGCGAGQTLIASGLGPHVTAVGIDLDHASLQLGRSLDARIRFVCSRGEQLPLRSAQFDLVICRVALPYMHTRLALAEMARVLKPGGKVWFTLHPFTLVARELVDNLANLRLRRAAHRLYVIANGALSLCTGFEIASPRSGRVESFQSRRAIERRLAEAGFEDIRSTDGPGFVVTATRSSVDDAAMRQDSSKG